MRLQEARLLKAGTVAEVLDVTEARVYDLCRQNILPHVRIGRQLRISPTQLDEFIQNGGQAMAGGWKRR